MDSLIKSRRIGFHNRGGRIKVIKKIKDDHLCTGMCSRHGAHQMGGDRFVGKVFV